jgi:hypothetical protein
MSEVNEQALQAHLEQVQAMDAQIVEHVQAIEAGEDRGEALQALIDQRNEVHGAASAMDRELNPSEPPAA